MINEQELRKYICCFTGHRPEKLNVSEEIAKNLLQKAIKLAISSGFKIFISGMARGIDIWAAEIILKEKMNNNNIKLWCASPYKNFESRRNEAELIKYNTIIEHADYVKYVCNHYTRYCFQIRNVWMVDRSNLVIAAYNGESGGTKNTIKYAEKSNIKVINIFDKI